MYPWETQPAAPQRPSAPNVSGFGLVLVAAAAFFVGSYFPYQPYDFSNFNFGRQTSKVSIEKGSWVLLVEETEDRSKLPWLAEIVSDKGFWAGLKSQGINWQFYDIEAGEIASYKPDAVAAGIPALLVISPSGRVRLAKSCPPTTEAIQELLGVVK